MMFHPEQSCRPAELTASTWRLPQGTIDHTHATAGGGVALFAKLWLDYEIITSLAILQRKPWRTQSIIDCKSRN